MIIEKAWTLLFQTQTMSPDERNVKDLIGEKAWNIIINAASSGSIDGQQMSQIAWALPTDRRRDKVGGDHKRRIDKGNSHDEAEMKQILVDWNRFGDMPEETGTVLKSLVKVFEDVNKPLARDLRKIKVNKAKISLNEFLQIYFQ